MATTAGRPPLWRDVRALAWAFQLLVVAAVVAVVWWLTNNYRTNTSRQGIATDWAFLDQPAQFPIANSTFRQTQPVKDAVVIGLANTLRLSITGIVLATIFGTMIGVARLSKNFLVRSAARAYVEFVRNVPLLVLLVLIYLGVVQNAFPRPTESWVLGPIAVINVRGANAIWYEGANWRAAIAVGVAILAGLVVARSRASYADRTGRPARAGGWGVLVSVVVLVGAWIVLGLGVTAPELDGTRVTGGINMTAAYFASLLPSSCTPRATSRRSSAARSRPCRRGKARQPTHSPCPGSSGSGTSCCPRPCASACPRSATSTSTWPRTPRSPPSSPFPSSRRSPS